MSDYSASQGQISLLVGLVSLNCFSVEVHLESVVEQNASVATA